MASFLSGLMGRLTGGGSGGGNGAVAEAEDYKGYTIIPAPRANGGQYNTAGIITKKVGEEVKEHRFIRADTHGSQDDAIRHSLSKARQIIDEQGDALFG